MILKTLAAETRYLRRLCRLHATKAAVTRRNEELQRLRRLINENRRRLKRLAIEAENCQGAYDTAVEALRMVALSRLQLHGKAEFGGQRVESGGLLSS